MGLTKVNYAMLDNYAVSVLAYGAVGDGVTDCTDAFNAALAASSLVYVPEGEYVVDNIFLQPNTQLIGAGKFASVLVQKTTSNPALNAISDPTNYPAIGQLLGIRVDQIGLRGKNGSTTATFYLHTTNGGAIWDSEFDVHVQYGKYGVQMIADANAIFFCKFNLAVTDTTDTCVKISGGVYNEYSVFATNADTGVCVDEATSHSVWTNCATDGQIKLAGSQNTYLNPTVELFPADAPYLGAGSGAIECSGNLQTLCQPTVILDSTCVGKVDFAFKPFLGTVIDNPIVTILSGTFNNPFSAAFGYEWTLIGPGINGCVNKIETIYPDNTSDNAQSLTTVDFVGDCSAWTVSNPPPAGKVIQYTDGTPTAPTIQLKNSTDAMLLNYAGTVADVYINTPYFVDDGHVVSFYAKSIITTIHWNPVNGETVTALPTTLAAGGKFSMIYRAADTTYYPI